jgi:hypothetical protein
MNSKGLVLIFIFFMILLFTLSNIFAYTFHTFGINSTLSEDQNPLFTYNFSANVSNESGDISATYFFENINSSLYATETNSTFYYWFSLNQNTGMMTINSSHDNMTGNYTATVKVKNQNNEIVGKNFYFFINATNDAPIFTQTFNEYNLTQNQTFISYVNASDEERHYPLIFNITFVNCSVAYWSTRNNTDCFLFNMINFSNTSAKMQFVPGKNDVGVYYANISVRDSGERYNCTSGSCEFNYSSNKTTYYSQLVKFNLFGTLEVNTSDCNNKVFYENQSNLCQINITTKGLNDTLNLTSIANINHYSYGSYNSNWFFTSNITTSNNYVSTILINITPQKNQIGNWTINFTVKDLSYNQNITERISIYVNRTSNYLPIILDMSNRNYSANVLTYINITSFDDDFLIPDKNISYGGFNESVNFSYRVFNISDMTQEIFFSGFSLSVLNQPITNTNRSIARVMFTPNASLIGTYAVNVTVKDRENGNSFIFYNLSVFTNGYPYYRVPFTQIYYLNESQSIYLNLSQNATDPDLNKINFSYYNYSSFDSFNLNPEIGRASCRERVYSYV